MLSSCSINIFNYLMELQRSERLINTLQNVNKRYCSMFFSKLVLLDEQPNQEVSYIRHYDLQCEAAQNIFSILQTKIKAISLKALYKIQRYTEQKMLTPIKAKKNFIRSNADNSFSKFSHSRNALSAISLYQPISPQYRQICESPKQNVRLQLHSNPQLEEIDRSISVLMGRVKNLSDKFNRKSKNYINIDQKDKINKRKIILSKLNQLENDLSTYLQRDQQKQREEERYNNLCKTPSQQTANFLTSSKYSQKMNMTTETRYHMNDSEFYQDSNRQDKSDTADRFYLHNYNSKNKYRFRRDLDQEGLKPIQFQNKGNLDRLLNVNFASDVKRKKFFK